MKIFGGYGPTLGKSIGTLIDSFTGAAKSREILEQRKAKEQEAELLQSQKEKAWKEQLNKINVGIYGTQAVYPLIQQKNSMVSIFNKTISQINPDSSEAHFDELDTLLLSLRVEKDPNKIVSSLDTYILNPKNWKKNRDIAEKLDNIKWGFKGNFSGEEIREIYNAKTEIELNKFTGRIAGDDIIYISLINDLIAKVESGGYIIRDIVKEIKTVLKTTDYYEKEARDCFNAKNDSIIKKKLEDLKESILMKYLPGEAYSKLAEISKEMLTEVDEKEEHLDEEVDNALLNMKAIMNINEHMNKTLAGYCINLYNSFPTVFDNSGRNEFSEIMNSLGEKSSEMVYGGIIKGIGSMGGSTQAGHTIINITGVIYLNSQQNRILRIFGNIAHAKNNASFFYAIKNVKKLLSTTDDLESIAQQQNALYNKPIIGNGDFKYMLQQLDKIYSI